MYPTNSLKNFYTFILSFFSIFIVWIILGLRTDNIIGLNDISHHLITILFGSNSQPFYTPIYDWLWMGGQLVAPNVGNIPFERFLLTIGLAPENSLSITIIFFQALIFYFSYLILEKNISHKTTIILASLSISFIPSVTLRIIYGHLSLFIPVLFNLIFIWILTSEKKSLFSIILATYAFLNLFAGPYFQILFYSVVLTWPIILFYLHQSFKKNLFLITWIFVSALFFNLDYLYLIFKYMSSGDLFRSASSNNLIYSYAKLKLDNFVDLLTYDFINLEELPFYFAHEIKAFIGILPLVYLVYKRPAAKSHYFLYVTIFVILLFIFCPTSLEFIFYKFPLLNMFRIPQRTILTFIVPLYLLIFNDLKDRTDSHRFLTVLLVVCSLGFGFYSLTALDFFLFFISLFFLFPYRRISISLKSFASVFLIANCFFLFHHPQRFTKKFIFDLPSEKSTILRNKIYSSNFWTVNTNRVLSANSIYGYTHPLPKYRELFTQLFNVNSIDLLYFKDVPGHPLNDNFQSLYRYFTDGNMAYSPDIITSDKEFFWKDIKTDESQIAKGSIAFVESKVNNINQSLCSKQLSVTNENIVAFNYQMTIFNNSNQNCFVVMPYNQSYFLEATSNQNSIQLFHTNLSQFGFFVPPGKNNISIGPDNSIFWNLKLLGFSLGLISFFTHYYYRRRYLS